jgi:hypothetical protein
MGVLTQKCIKNFPAAESERIINENNGSLEVFDAMYAKFGNNKTNWHFIRGRLDAVLCGNASGSGTCPDNYTCIQGARFTDSWQTLFCDLCQLVAYISSGIGGQFKITQRSAL